MKVNKVTRAFGHEMKLLAKKKTAMQISTGVLGGYTVPPELLIGVDAYLAEQSIFHERAFQQPMKSAMCDMAGFDLAATHVAGQSPLFGGMYVAWGQEGIKIPENDPTFTSGQLVARNLQATVLVSNQLVEDGGETLGAYLECGFARAICWAVERGCLRGTGVTDPMGIVNAPGSLQVSRAGSGHIAQADLANMAAALHPACFRNCIWMCNPTSLGDIAALAAYIVQGHDDHMCGQIFGRPLYVTENLPVKGTLGDLILFDPTMYVLGTHCVDVQSSGQVNFNTFQTMFRLVWRGDGQPFARKTFTAADDSTTMGCYVVLK